MEPSLPSHDQTSLVRPSTRRELQLHGARPSALKVRKDSHKIKKQPPAAEARQPVIIYTVSPKVIHADTSEFMSLVQRLTGAGGTSSDTSTGSIRGVPQAPPSAARVRGSSDQLDGLDELLGIVTVSARNGVMPPVPSSLLSPEWFPVPAVVGHRQLDFFNELSPSCSGNGRSSSLPIPYNLLCTTTTSTSPGSRWNSILYSQNHDH